ncbi:hypothetical protein AJ79_01770 [Helicocarpus griseus UAMH5409]|uniref:HNH nuclease domain-containing protein n=1 Tax=Helicocarpus griseus UAMH5409 TaxID=1447875 RepID=A0A2B7Y5R6_9EURO|nr:hypothetical protein AJ79_01770 [Helicocarpus griseus UAMH5409]
MDKTPTRNRQKLMKKLCLKRDDFRCLATGAIDINYHGTRESLTGNSGITELAHVIPFSMGAWVISWRYVCQSFGQYDMV